MKIVEVVIPCYNYARFLRQSVESALNQQGVAVRVSIIDDCSTDASAEVGEALAQEHHAVRFRRHDANKGHIATYNEGIAELRGDYFLLLSADDYLLPGALERAVRLMEEQPEVGFVFGRALLAAENTAPERLTPLPGRLTKNGGAVFSGRRFVEYSRARNIVPTPSAVVRTKLQLAAGGYREDLPHTGDMEMWLRLAARANVGYLDRDQAVYRMHGTNMSKTYDGLADLKARAKALEAFFADGVSRIDPTGTLERECLRRFAGEAFRHASMALNRGELEAADRFREYGLSVSPTARLSVNWLKLSVKRTLRRLSPIAGH